MPQPSPTLSLLAQPDFLRFWFARVAAMVAHQMLAVGVGWQIYALTGSELDLGFVGLAQFVPAFLLVLVAGHAADRFDRRRVLQACVVVEALAAAGLALGSYQGWITEAWIFALIFTVGAARAFQMPATAAMLPSLVPREIFPRAIASNSVATQAAVIAGPAIGGLVYVAGPGAVYGASVALFVLTGALVQLIRPARRPPRTEKVDLDSVLAGIRFIRGRPVVLGAISLDLFAVLLGGATALLPIYARDVLDTGPWGLGLLRSSTAVGALAMALYLARHPLRGGAGKRMFAGVAVFGLATLVFGVSRWFPLSLAALMILGAADMISVVVRQSLVQLQTPRCNARTRLHRQRAFHRNVQSTRRIRVRADRCVVRHRAVGNHQGPRHARSRRAVDALVPGPRRGGPARHATDLYAQGRASARHASIGRRRSVR